MTRSFNFVVYFLFPTYNSFRLILQEPSNQSPQPRPSSLPEPSITRDENKYRCRRCTQRFPVQRQLYLRGMQEHYQSGGGALQAIPWEDDQAPWEVADDLPLKTVYEANAPIILENQQESSVSSTYNVPLTNDFTVPEMMEHAERIYDRQGHAFRLNLEFGPIIRHTETGEYRYFRPFANESLFECPVYISRRKDLNRLRLCLHRFNVSDYILRQRPDTKWKPYLITNVRFVLYHLNYPLGNAIQLPEYIFQSKSIVALDKNFHNQRHSKDHLCAFRCLAVHREHLRDRLETQTRVLYDRWIQFANDKHLDVGSDPMQYQGLPLHQIAYFERCFSINVNVYHLRDDCVALTIYKSRCHVNDTMHVN